LGLFDKIFGRDTTPPRREETSFRLLSDYRPVFRTWGGELYEDSLVRASIDAKARNISKLQMVIQGSAKPKLMTQLRRRPNSFQTWGQFLYRVSTILDMQNTAIIVPVINDTGETVGIFPVYYTRLEVVAFKGEPWLRMEFANNDRAAVQLSKVGILTKFQYRNDLFGESNRALDPTARLIDMQNQAIQEGVKMAASYQFMATLSNFANDEDLAKERQRFTEQNLRASNASGVLLWPNTYKDVKQIETKPYVVDPEQMKLIRTNVFEYFGTNEDVLQNKAYGDAWAAFYEGSIEPFAVQLSDVLTNMLFTTTEQANGALIMATANRLQYMTNKDKADTTAIFADRGLATINELREIWNLPPLPDGLGDTIPVRGEYYDLRDNDEEGGILNVDE
jgi:HK97 family phage portal protein